MFENIHCGKIVKANDHVQFHIKSDDDVSYIYSVLKPPSIRTPDLVF